MSSEPTGGLPLEASDLRIAFAGPAGPPRVVVDGATLRLAAGTAAALVGPSGAGKTTLLHVLAGMELPAAGTVRWGGNVVSMLPERARDAWRRRHLGLVFQDFHLVEGLSALDNVLLPAWFEHARVPTVLREHAAALLREAGIPEPGLRIEAMSRGERQRVAMARALLRRPGVLLADEPTASLDAAAGRRAADLLLGSAAASGATLLVATHDPDLMARLPHRFSLENGRLEAQR